MSGKVRGDNVEGDKLVRAGDDVPVVRSQLHREDCKLVALLREKKINVENFFFFSEKKVSTNDQQEEWLEHALRCEL